MSRHDFDFLHGAWTVRHRILRERLNGCEDWDDYDGRATCAPVLGSTGNLDEIELPHLGTLGATLRLFDPDQARWTQSFAPAGSDVWEPNWVMLFERAGQDPRPSAR